MDQRNRCVGIDSYTFSLLSQHSYIHYILCKCMNQSFQKFTLIFMQFSIGKKNKKINSKFGFQKRKPDFGFKTENRISGFRLTSLVGIYKNCYYFVCAILSVPFCPCHFVQYHFVRSPLKCHYHKHILVLVSLRVEMKTLFLAEGTHQNIMCYKI